jgi:molybdopterin synthase sulfur carrier subunit
MARVLIPTALRQYTQNNESQLDIRARTISEVISELVKANQRLAKHIVDERGELRNFVNVFLNDEDVRYLQGGATRVSDSDTIRIVPAIAGGRQISSGP